MDTTLKSSLIHLGGLSIIYNENGYDVLGFNYLGYNLNGFNFLDESLILNEIKNLSSEVEFAEFKSELSSLKLDSLGMKNPSDGIIADGSIENDTPEIDTEFDLDFL